MPAHFKDPTGRTILLRGVNLADGKFPPGQPSHQLSSLDSSPEAYSRTSYLDAPFSPDAAPRHLARLRHLGLNALRLPVVWEALEHGGPGIYDDAYIGHVARLVRACNDRGFRVLINPHQDLFSRFAGGSGAPLWALHACALDPDSFADTHAAVLYAEWPLDSGSSSSSSSSSSPKVTEQGAGGGGGGGGRGAHAADNNLKDPKSMPPMMWTSNHTRLAPATLFALFFGGRDFAPRCAIDGVNIQDYLQGHYLAAYGRLAEALGDLAWGWDSMNEPEPGFIGWEDLGVAEREDSARIGSTPSPVQAMRLGMGWAQTVDEYRLGKSGPHKVGTVTVEPGRGCWLAEEDRRWKWKRSEEWPLGQCVWALHGVWDVETGELKEPGYFSKVKQQPPSSDSSSRAVHSNGDAGKTGQGPMDWKPSYWKEFHDKWAAVIRRHSPKATIFFQPPVFATPPQNLISSLSRPNSSSLGPTRMAYSPHFYDALTVMKGHWHKYWNVDIVTLLRGPREIRHKLKVLRVGPGSVRKVISDQLGHIASDVQPEQDGKDGKDGRDGGDGLVPTLIGETGIPFDLDGGKAYGDGDYTSQVAAMDAILSGCDDHLLSYTIWAYSAVNDHEWGDGWNGEDLSIYCSETNSFPGHKHLAGFRAAASFCRPYVHSLDGWPLNMSFDLKTSKFVLEIECEGPGDAVVYVPWLHYRKNDVLDGLDVKVKVSGGQCQWSLDSKSQLLRWTYEEAGRMSLEMERAGGPLSKRQLGTLV